MLDKIKAVEAEVKNEIEAADSLKGLDELRVKYLGRKGIVTQLLAQIATLPPQDKPRFGSELNSLKIRIAELFKEKQKKVSVSEGPSGEFTDLTLPGFKPAVGAKHPITSTIEAICGIFTGMGFKVVEGPEIETEFYNFEALNIPLNHPSRDAFDTFYIKTADSGQPSASLGFAERRAPRGERTADKKNKYLLRSHTSPVQARYMEQHKPPFKIIVPGRVYRPDAVDASHSFMFHQVEGFVVGKGVSFSDLKGALSVFIREYFGNKVNVRFRPHFFPFTEPSAEVDVSCIICQRTADSDQRSENTGNRCSVCGGKGWLEILGCGMIHPNVFKAVKYNPDEVTGFAFGMGVDRIAMLKYGINDIRLFYENDIRFLEQFR